FAAAGIGAVSEARKPPEHDTSNSSPSATSRFETHLKLWNRQPAAAPGAREGGGGWNNSQAWVQALPVGNGRLGGMVFGGMAEERIQLNEESLWSGSPQDADNPEAHQYLPAIRQLLFEGKYAEAQKLTYDHLACKGAG